MGARPRSLPQWGAPAGGLREGGERGRDLWLDVSLS